MTSQLNNNNNRNNDWKITNTFLNTVFDEGTGQILDHEKIRRKRLENGSKDQQQTNFEN